MGTSDMSAPPSLVMSINLQPRYHAGVRASGKGTILLEHHGSGSAHIWVKAGIDQGDIITVPAGCSHRRIEGINSLS